MFPDLFCEAKTLKENWKRRQNEIKSLSRIEAKIPNKILLKITHQECLQVI